MRYITLTPAEIEALELIHKNSPNNTVRKRSQCILLSHKKRTIINLATLFDVNRRTIERWYDAWNKNGVDSLPIAAGRGAKTLLNGYEQEIGEQLKIHSRNLKNVLQYLDEKHSIIICKKTLQNFLKGTGL